jgi:hypothetical protein
MFESPAHLFSIRAALAYTPAKLEAKSKSYVAPNPEFGTSIWYHLKTPSKEVNITIFDVDKAGKVKVDDIGHPVRVLRGPNTVGLHRVNWDLWNDFRKADMAALGDYVVRLTVDGKTFTQKLRIDAPE